MTSLEYNRERIEHLEERASFFTHALGTILSVFALYWILAQTIPTNDLWKIGSAALFGTSMVLLYLASTLYHGTTDEKLKARFKVMDHAAIYCLIAGSYTPFTLVTLKESVGWILFTVVWAIALFGVIFKLYYTGRFRILSTLIYLMMGWLVIFAIEPIREAIPYDGLVLIFTGGMFYTVGAVIYMLERPLFHHAIWHLFVMAGSAFHYLAVLFYVCC